MSEFKYTLNAKSVCRVRKAEKLSPDKVRRLYNLLLSDAEKKAARDLIARGRKMRPKVNYGTVAYIFREGARLFIQQQNRLLDKAEAGTLHAKPRKR